VEYVATPEQGHRVIDQVKFPWWWTIEIVPVGTEQPVPIMLMGEAMLDFGEPQGPQGTYPIVDPETGLPNPVPPGGTYMIPVELLMMDLVGHDPTNGAEVRLMMRDGMHSTGQVLVQREGNVLIGDSFFDVFFDITYELPGAPPMVLRPANPNEPVRLQMPFTPNDNLRPTDVRWMPTIFWQTGFGRDLLDNAGVLWDKLISIHTVPHVELERPVRIIVDPNLAFGNKPVDEPGGSIHGMKWHDLDADGVKDPNEPGLDGWTIKLLGPNGNVITQQQTMSMDVNNDGVIDPVRETGLYWFDPVRPGPYTVMEVLQPGWNQSAPGGNGMYSVIVAPNQSIENLDFGNWRPGSIHGFKWCDIDRDGVLDPNEPGVPDITIYLDLNANMKLDPGEPTTMTMRDNPLTDVDETGHYWFNDLDPGLYLVREYIPDMSYQTYPGFNASPIVGTMGDVVQIPAPASVQISTAASLRSDANLHVFPEKQGVTLGANLLVDRVLAGMSPPANPGIILAGIKVDSFLVHGQLNTAANANLTGKITFDQIILGVIYTSARLDSTDVLLGAAGTLYPAGGAQPARGMEGVDKITISPDLLSIEIDFSLGAAADQIRVITVDAGGGYLVELESNEEIFGLDFGNIVVPGDIDGDGDTDLVDFDIMKQRFGMQNAKYGDGDLDGNGVVDLRDFDKLKANFGKSKPRDPNPAAAPRSFSTSSLARAADIVFSALGEEEEDSLELLSV
jgi:hypothetical protein